MFIHPDLAKTKVSNVDRDCIQPNGYDLRIERIFRVRDTAYILKDKTVHGKHEEDLPIFWNLNDGDPQHEKTGWSLLGFSGSNMVYQFETEHEVEIGEGEVGWLIPRSSLVRNGMTIHSGLYDSGFKGKIGGVLIVHGLGPFIEKGARVCQLVIAPAQAVHQYQGQYQNTGVVTEND